MSNNDYYANVKIDVSRSTVGEERVEVNQRALIDKILARYASAGACYRELLQNSNDANATCAEIYFTTNRNDDKEIVTNVTYRNNGMKFRPQDWARLKSIAEGNPDESKIGAFGVGAYTMFSICEEPMVLSGTQALAFFWKGDALWTKTITTTNRPKEDQPWTSFVLPSRDPYVIPCLVEFGKFLCASLTFTKCLNEIRVYVNHKRRLTIIKTLLQEPTVVQINSSKNNNSWFSWNSSSNNKGGTITTSPSGLFALKCDQSLLESIYHVQVDLDGDVGTVTARYLSGLATTNVPADMASRMERVTKKKPPSKVEVQIFLSHDINYDNDGIGEIDESKRRNYPSSSSQKKRQEKHRAVRRIVQSFSPRMGEGRIFIGFRTSQTTGLAAHLSAPFIPTVEREAMDLQDHTLRIFNLELLDFAGILMRLTLEHSMIELGLQFEKGASERKEIETKLLREAKESELQRKKKKNDSISSGVDNQRDSAQVGDDEGGTASTNTANNSVTGSTLFGFAKFMAKGVKKTIKNVVTNISDLVDDGGELIFPLDLRPLCVEEHQCIKLMQSFCPRQSTPDPMVGTALAQGFSRCIQDRAPPVLTRSGVVPGDKGRLPNNGMEAFVDEGVIRKVVYQNAEEYHDVIAQCRKLSLDDLIQKLSKDVLDESKLIRLIKWWVKFSGPKIQSHFSAVQGAQLKETVRFFLDKINQENNDEALQVYHLKDFLFYLDKDRIRSGSGYSIEDLPMPDSILPKHIHEEVTTRVLSDTALNAWFSPLPIEIWIDFVSQHPCMTSGQPEYDKKRLQVLSTLGNEHRSRSLNEQRVFGNFCRNLLKEKRCLPFDSTEPLPYAADLPSNLYLNSAELNAFSNIGNFHKVSKSLQHMGVSDDFLLSLGVRKSVAIEFLFENLHTLRYHNDPKPLVEYLQSATLTSTDIQQLRNTQYLPAENDVSRMFAPGELFLPDTTFRIFPFVRIMQWPSEDDITERSPNGKFLVTLGMKPLPELLQVLRYISDEVTDDVTRLCCLDFVAKRLGSGGSYELPYSKIIRSDKLSLKFLPCKIKSPLSGVEKQTWCSLLNCCSNNSAGVMGFPTLNFKEIKNKMYGNLFQCVEEPSPTALLQQLQVLVSLAKKTLGAAAAGSHRVSFSRTIIATFSEIFNYMSSRTSEIDASRLNNEEIIPCLVNEEIQWFRPTMIFFKNKSSDDEIGDITQSLFHVVDFSPFLAGAGVRQDASTKDIFRRMIDSPQAVLSAVKSEENYRALLRRVAANRPFRRVTDEIRDAPFLLAYIVSETKNSNDKFTFELAKAEDIFVIDNSFFGRMFPVKRAPHESDLEEFYALLGANYISKVVRKKFDVIGSYQHKTAVTEALAERISERGPLLLSSSNTSRSLADNASSILEQKNLEIIQAPELKAIYSLDKCVRTQQTTCCVRQGMFGKNSLVVTSNFDWFDVGFAIGELILKRCQLEDAFLISSLLETPLQNLRDRGFPVDRIIKPNASPEIEPKTDPPLSEPMTTAAKISSGSNSRSGNNDAGVASNASGDETKLDRKEENTSQSNNTDGCSKNDEVQKEPPTSKDDHISMLKQMYPGVDESYLRDKLGDNPNLDKVRSVAEEMAMKGYPKDEVVIQKSENLKKKEEKKSPSKLLGSKKLGKAFSGLKSSNFGGIPNHLKLGQSEEMMSGPSTGKNDSVAPKDDAELHTNMEHMLQKRVQNAARSVDSNGIKSPEVSISIPEGLDHGSSCEIIPSQDITPFIGTNGESESHNSIKIFSYRKDETSNNYLRVNFDAVECFAVVLERLCVVFELPKHSVAIYHHPTSNVIAFNSSGALYFNIRYFYRIHYARNLHRKRECYSYWFVVACHELAHNMEGPHNRTHAFYTESYTSLYLPKLMALFDQVDE